MDKLTFMRLWDLYHALLTPTQREITDMYFNLDLTLSEIAAEKGITRQGVSECLKTCKKQLEDYENKLRFSESLDEYSSAVSHKLTEAGRWAGNFKEAHPEYAAEIAALEEILAGTDVKDVASRETTSMGASDGKPITKSKKGK